MDDLDSLFSAPPTGFIEERKRVVAALKDAGRKDEAKTVEKIPRPSLALWTVNQIARRDPELVRRLGEITARLQSAAGPEYAEAAAEHRHVLQELRERASEVLGDAGQEVAPHVVQRVIANLRTAASTPETRATLERGRLVRDVEEHETDGLFGVAGAPDNETATSAPASGRHSASTPATDAAAAVDAKARERARAKELADAEREVKRRRSAEASARKEVEGAERAVFAARESLNVKEIRAASARAAAETAAQALAQAEADLARLSKP